MSIDFLGGMNLIIPISSLPLRTRVRIGPQRIWVRLGPQHPLAYRRRRLDGSILRMRPRKPRFRVTADWLITPIPPCESLPYMETSPLPVKSWETYRSMLGVQSLWVCEGSLSCHTFCNRGPQFFRSHPEEPPPLFASLKNKSSRLWQHVRRYWGPILTSILMGVTAGVARWKSLPSRYI
jgi:hypothetical protein